MAVTSVEELPVVPVREVVEEQEAYRVTAVDDPYAVTVLIDGQPTPVRMLGVEPQRRRPILRSAAGFGCLPCVD